MRKETSQSYDGSDPPLATHLDFEGAPRIKNGFGLYFYMLGNELHIPAELYHGLTEASWAAFWAQSRWPDRHIIIEGYAFEPDPEAFAN